MKKRKIEKEEAKQVFAQIFGIKRGDWVKKKYRGRKIWVVVGISTLRGRKYAYCWRKRGSAKYRYLFYESIRERIPLSNLILVEDRRNPEHLEVPRS